MRSCSIIYHKTPSPVYMLVNGSVSLLFIRSALHPFSWSGLQAGPYEIAWTVTDLIRKGKGHVSDHFEVSTKTPR